MDNLAGARHKFERAKQHIENFHAHGLEFLAAEVPQRTAPISKRFEPSASDPMEGTFVYYVDEFPVHPPVALSLILGDALTNLRAVIDYVAWRIAVHPPKPHRVQFPLCDHLNAFAGTAKTQIPNVDPMHLAIVDRYQPYHWPAAIRRDHPLSTLNRLVREDKHRELTVITALSVETKASFDPAINTVNFQAIEYWIDPRPPAFRVGTELLKIRGRIIDPSVDPEVKVKWFDDKIGLGLEGEDGTVETLLHAISVMVNDILTEFERIL